MKIILIILSLTIIGLFGMGLSCTEPVTLSITTADNGKDSLFVFTDDTLPKKFNPGFQYKFDEG
ncbi:MAG: hypothetical protein ACXVNO_00085 [Bacteroidia bacterium]